MKLKNIYLVSKKYMEDIKNLTANSNNIRLELLGKYWCFNS